MGYTHLTTWDYTHNDNGTYHSVYIPEAHFSNSVKTAFCGQIKKSMKPFTCKLCGKEKDEGTRYLGNNYEKVCHDCFEKWCEANIEQFNFFIESLKEVKKKVAENKDKLEQEILLKKI